MVVRSSSGIVVGASIKGERLKQVVAQMRAMASSEVLVGIPAATTERRAEPRQKWDWDGQTLTRRPEPTAEEPTNAELGYIHEFGAPEANIPARPFLIPGVKNAMSASLAYLKQGAQRSLKGKGGAVEEAYHQAGLAAQSAVRNKITSGPFEPLKESTLETRRARGRTGTRPLIDTGQLRNSITYVIRAVTGRGGKK